MDAKLIALTVALATGASALADTYWLNAASANAAPPNCFKFYSDEACKSAVTVKPTADDGNTYVVLGASKVTGGYTAPAGTTWIFGKDGKTVGSTAGRAYLRTNGGPTLNFGACTIYGIKVSVNSTGILSWGGTSTLVNSGQGFEFESSGLGASDSSAGRAAALAGKFISDSDVTIKMTRNGGADGLVPEPKISGDFTEFKGGFALGAGSSATMLNGLNLTSASAFGDSSVERADYLTVGNWTRWSIGSGVTQYATKGIQLDLSESGTSAMYANDGASWTLSAPVTTKSGGGGASEDGSGQRDPLG